MIVGNGSLASMLNDREEFIFFASGVSNSTISSYSDVNERIREAGMLGVQIASANLSKKMLVYFGTISIFYQSSYYAEHKRSMEELVRQRCDNYTILRLGNIFGCTNPNTFINVMKAAQEAGKNFTVKDEYRYMISKEQLALITDHLPSAGKHEICVFGEMKKVRELI